MTVRKIVNGGYYSLAGFKGEAFFKNAKPVTYQDGNKRLVVKQSINGIIFQFFQGKRFEEWLISTNYSVTRLNTIYASRG